MTLSASHWQVAAAIRAYGSLIRADLGGTRGLDGDELGRHLAEARVQRDLFAAMLHRAPQAASAGWRLRGEIVVHLDRLTSELQVERLSRARQDEGRPSWIKTLRGFRFLAPAMSGSRCARPRTQDRAADQSLVG